MTDDPKKKPYRRKDHPEHMTGLKPIEKGRSGNPGGFTKAMRAKREEQFMKAEAAVGKMLDALLLELDKPDAALSLISADKLKLVHAAIERYEGKAVAKVDNTSSDGSVTMPSVIRLVGPDAATDDNG